LIDAPRPELYDLESDPVERQNLFARRPVIAAGLSARLTSFDPSISGSRRQPLLPAASPEVRERLAALGYVSGTGDRRAKN
jgi:hypothetical protein